LVCTQKNSYSADELEETATTTFFPAVQKGRPTKRYKKKRHIYCVLSQKSFFSDANKRICDFSLCLVSGSYWIIVHDATKN
jgi:hypothetical protein